MIMSRDLVIVEPADDRRTWIGMPAQRTEPLPPPPRREVTVDRRVQQVHGTMDIIVKLTATDAEGNVVKSAEVRKRNAVLSVTAAMHARSDFVAELEAEGFTIKQ